MKHKLEKKKSSATEARNPRLMRQQSSRIEDRLKVKNSVNLINTNKIMRFESILKSTYFRRRI